MATSTEIEAMRLALTLARSEGAPLGPNPRVGAVILDSTGHIVGQGFHRGAGSPHAEVDALRDAGERAVGGVVVVTLEPCNHHGRTGPCSVALLNAEVKRVVFAQSDLSAVASGGAEFLVGHGVDVEGGVLGDEARRLNERWTYAHENGRPWVTYKFAATLDGRIAAPDSTSQWISSDEARLDVHRLRAQVDAVMVGTGTVLHDNPRLTVRGVEASPERATEGSIENPLRVVVGERDVPLDSRIFDGSSGTVHLRTRDLPQAMSSLYQQGVQWAMLEGGATLAGAFFAAGLVNEVVAYIAPSILGAGSPSIEIPGVTSIGDVTRLETTSVEVVGVDIRVTAQVPGS